MRHGKIKPQNIGQDEFIIIDGTGELTTSGYTKAELDQLNADVISLSGGTSEAYVSVLGDSMSGLLTITTEASANALVTNGKIRVNSGQDQDAGIEIHVTETTGEGLWLYNVNDFNVLNLNTNLSNEGVLVIRDSTATNTAVNLSNSGFDYTPTGTVEVDFDASLNVSDGVTIDGNGAGVNGTGILVTTQGDNPAASFQSTAATNSPVVGILGNTSTGVSDGKAFSVSDGSGSFAEGMFYTDGKYGISGGTATRDIFISRKDVNQMRISNIDGSNNPTAGHLYVYGDIRTENSGDVYIDGLTKALSGNLLTWDEEGKVVDSGIDSSISDASGVSYTPGNPFWYYNRLPFPPTTVEEGLNSAGNNAFTGYVTSVSNASSTLIDGGEFGVLGTDTIYISAGSGQTLDFGNLDIANVPTSTRVTWDGMSVTIPNITGADFTVVSIDTNGDPFLEQNAPTTESYRDRILLGKVIHRTGNVDFVSPVTQYARETYAQMSDLALAIGPMNLTGNVYGPHDDGSTLEIAKTAGRSFRWNSNSTIDPQNPHITTEAASDPDTFFRVYRDGSGGWTYLSGQTTIDPENYDDGSGTLSSVGGGFFGRYFQVMRLYMFPRSGRTYVFYGQDEYTTFDNALEGVTTEDWEGPPDNFYDASLRAYLIVQGGITSLNDPADFRFIDAGKFQGGQGGGGAGGGGVTTFSDDNFAVYYDSQPDKTFTFDLSPLDTTGEGIVLAANASQDGDITITLPSVDGQLALTSDIAAISGDYVNVTGDTMTGQLTAPDVAVTSLTPASSGNVLTWDEDGTIVDGGVNTDDVNNMLTIQSDLQEPTGFVNTNTDSTISVDDSTRTFNISAGSPFKVYVRGEAYEFTNESVVWEDVENTHYFVINPSGNLEVSKRSDFATFDDLIQYIIYDNAFIAEIYWDATNSKSLLLDERHGAVMDAATHYNLHIAEGTRYISGFALGDFTTNAAGSLDSHAQFTSTAGQVLDEDVHADIAAKLLAGNITLLYRDATDNWRWNTDSAPILTTGTGRAAWNENTGGTWGLTEVDNNDFFCAHIFGGPITQGGTGLFAIMGQAEYNTVSAARTGAATEISNLITEGVPLPEFVAVATIIYQTSNGYSNTWKSRVRTTDEGDDFISWLNVTINAAGSPSDHNNLASLQGGTAGEYFHLTSAEYTQVQSLSGSYVEITGDTMTGELVVTSGITGAGLTDSTLSGNAGNMVTVDAAGKLQTSGIPVDIGLACSDETTDLTTGDAKVTFRAPHAFTITSVKASLTTATSGADLIVDINEEGTSIFSTKLTIDATEKTSTTASTAAVISGAAIADDAEMTIDIDQVGSSIAGAGLKVWIIGER